jgi:hypothetical protein
VGTFGKTLITHPIPEENKEILFSKTAAWMLPSFPT